MSTKLCQMFSPTKIQWSTFLSACVCLRPPFIHTYNTQKLLRYHQQTKKILQTSHFLLSIFFSQIKKKEIVGTTSNVKFELIRIQIDQSSLVRGVTKF